MYVDIGELGWSLYLSAHLRWLKKNTNHSLAIMTSADRKCLYRESTNSIINIPDDFYRFFKAEQDCFGLHRVPNVELKNYFKGKIPLDYIIPEYFNFNCDCRVLLNKVIYKPYKYTEKLKGKRKILIFPRYRNHPAFRCRNLPKSFYIELIKILCNKFPDYGIKTIGLNSGSYNIEEIRKNNYVNGIKKKADLQDMINECQLAVGAIGSQSAPLKLTLLQRISTFMIGHEKNRHTKEENWMRTRAGFYEIAKNSYANFSFKECIGNIVSFIKEENK